MARSKLLSTKQATSGAIEGARKLIATRGEQRVVEEESEASQRDESDNGARATEICLPVAINRSGDDF